MEDMLVVVLSMLLALLLVPLYLWKRRQNSQSSKEHEDEPQVDMLFLLVYGFLLHVFCYKCGEVRGLSLKVLRYKVTGIWD